MAIELTTEQNRLIDSLLVWFTDSKKHPYVTVGGYAGTGKTTLIAEFRKKLYSQNKIVSVGFCCYTGKAARVLKTKLSEAKVILGTDFVGTIHSLMYSPDINLNGEIIGWKKKDEIENDLIIVDEASMVDGNIWEDLLSYKIPIIAVGDHGQLPPIKGNFNLMQSPMLKLEHIHRQEKDNPIIELSIMARTTGVIPVGEYGKNIKKISRSDEASREIIGDLLDSYNEDTLVLCGYNITRVKLNRHIRSVMGHEGEDPEGGDVVVCLRNNHEQEIYNGMIGKVMSYSRYDNDWATAEIAFDGLEDMYKGMVSVKQFNNLEPINFTKNRSKVSEVDLFDFGYALTVHKAQGSQAKRVILFEEKFSRMSEDEWRRWLYTAVTRAEKELIIIGK